MKYIICTSNSKVVAKSLVHSVYVWQSQVEIEHYFTVYFDRIIVFEAL